ncbi:MAG: hypothetical protein JXR23_07565 [Pontiellaceae bacterium]|nr:hypothetical protein [Pontiellaceae bacterium]
MNKTNISMPSQSVIPSPKDKQQYSAIEAEFEAQLQEEAELNAGIPESFGKVKV